MRVNVLPADTYIVINKTILTNYDREVLTMLYQPIIGIDATSFYTTLWSYLDKELVASKEWTHHHLMLSMRTKLSVIEDAKEKLEAIGLLKTYYKKGDINNYVYELYSPMSAYEYFNNPILNSALLNNCGKEEYDRLVNYFKLPKFNFKEYVDITATFNDVFEPQAYTSYEKLVDDIKKNNKRDLVIDYKIDFKNILSNIPENLLSATTLNKELKTLITNLAYIYDLKDDDLTNIIRNSLLNNRIDKETLKVNARNYYRFNNDGKLPSLIFKNQPDFLKKDVTSSSKKAQLIHMFETYSPYNFLSLKNGNVKPNKNDLLLLEELMIDLELTPGVTNVLIDYVLRINNNKLTKAYVIAIATQWKRSNIETVEEAMTFAGKEQTKKTKPSYKPKENLKPDWIDKTFETNQASAEEEAKLKARLEKFK